MVELSYSLHLGNDKNKSKKARKTSKSNQSGTTSLNNNSIQNLQQLSKVDKHNLRKYDDEQELIKTIKGTSSVVEDIKNLYLDLFEESRIKYNERQTRNDRKIDNYFNHISNDNKRDLACEIIIELGDMDFWSDKDDKFKHKMVDVFKEQIQDLENVVPNFKIANATIHFDESSPHLHIVGVPFKDGMKNGMEKQVGKSDVFTKISLVNIQDKMREYCISSFNRIYNLNYSLKDKEEGRNIDINVSNMKDYNKFRKEQEKHKKQLKELNDKANQLQNKSNEINDIINNLKPTMMNKNNYTISNVDIDKIKKYIEQTNDTTSNLKDSNDINVILDKYEQDLKNHSNEVKELKKKITTREDRISDLENRLDFANDTIDMLEDKVDKLQETLNYFKELWKKFIKFLQDKFFSSNKYDDLIDELHEEEIIDDADLEVIQNEFSSNYSKDDDLERKFYGIINTRREESNMENVKLMNMCKIIDANTNKILVQERVKSWKGIAFPGGKINNGESIVKSTIREVKEETGLDVNHLELCGVKNWYNEEKNERSIVFLYTARSFSGNLISETDEGKNYWISEEELSRKELANNFDIMLKVFGENNYSEMLYSEENKDWILY